MKEPQSVFQCSPLQRLGTIDPHYFAALLALVFIVAVLVTLLARAGNPVVSLHEDTSGTPSWTPPQGGKPCPAIAP